MRRKSPWRPRRTQPKQRKPLQKRKQRRPSQRQKQWLQEKKQWSKKRSLLKLLSGPVQRKRQQTILWWQQLL
ncbi:hypothetical protein KSF_105860 [Reticulibacter mediterranei]|uniref:Uncharacterized protein n=1 Tax=Reticulibacter mediterranei TaxID=2778369 RepID=A0A8J3N9A2_9CHLR|nr:hypothetical protein KSF_105860 [Reticulibacter mediterranei]